MFYLECKCYVREQEPIVFVVAMKNASTIIFSSSYHFFLFFFLCIFHLTFLPNIILLYSIFAFRIPCFRFIIKSILFLYVHMCKCSLISCLVRCTLSDKSSFLSASHTTLAKFLSPTPIILPAFFVRSRFSALTF